MMFGHGPGGGGHTTYCDGRAGWLWRWLWTWFEGYDVNKTYLWPGPNFEKFNGSKFIKDQITFPGKQLFAEKILVGDFNNDTYPDLFLVSHIDEWAGCTNCKPTPINPPHIIFNSPTGFNRVKFKARPQSL